MSTETSSPSSKQSGLRANAIGLPGVLFQSITTMAPASAVAFSLGAAIPFAGGALPLAVLIALIVCTLIALNIGSLARHLPSAGGYFTYVSRGLGPQAGWMTGWLFSLTYLLIVPLQLLVLGPVMDSFAQQYFHLSFGPNGWAVWAMVFAVIVFGLTYFGIKISADTSVVMGAIEIGVFVLLSIWLIATAGNGNTAATFNPASSLETGLSGWQGILHGMIFAFLAFAGFESSAPLAEEAHNPRRTVPRAILLATVSIGVFYVFCSYAGVVGWPFSKISTYPFLRVRCHSGHSQQRTGQRQRGCQRGFARALCHGAYQYTARPPGAYQCTLPHTGYCDHLYDDRRCCLYPVARFRLWCCHSLRPAGHYYYYPHPGGIYGNLPDCPLLLPARTPG